MAAALQHREDLRPAICQAVERMHLQVCVGGGAGGEAAHQDRDCVTYLCALYHKHLFDPRLSRPLQMCVHRNNYSIVTIVHT